LQGEIVTRAGSSATRNPRSTMSISSTGVISWASPVLGSFNVTLRADNGKAYSEQLMNNDAIISMIWCGLHVGRLCLRHSKLVFMIGKSDVPLDF
jgi:hypothetical protein